MSAEAPRTIKELPRDMQHPFAVLEFFTTLHIEIVKVHVPPVDSLASRYAVLKRTVEVNGRPQGQTISALEPDLEFLNRYFSGIVDVVPESPIAIAQQNFLAIRLAIRNFKP